MLVGRGRIAELCDAPDGEDGITGEGGHMRGAALVRGTGGVGGLVYQSTQAVAPKMFEARLDDLVGGSTLGIGAVVFSIYLLAGLGQLLGGWLADRWSWKRAYLVAWCIHMPMLWIAASAGGPLLVLVVFLITPVSYTHLPLPTTPYV